MFDRCKSVLCFVQVAGITMMVLFFTKISLADDQPMENQASMSEIVVTATRYKEDVSNIPANVTVITKEEIKKSTAQNIPDLLRYEVGIKVNDINGSRRNYTVDVRGFGETAGSNTLVLVDGRRVNQADLSGTDWTQIPLDRTERIEIIRGGSGSVLYGDNASGGVINIITKEGDRFGGEVSGGVGSYDTYKSNMDLSGEKGGLSFALSGSTLTSDGYRDNSNTRAKNAGLNLAFDVQDRFRIHLDSGFHKDNTSLPGALIKSELAAGSSRTDTMTPFDFANVEDYYLHGGPEIYFGEASLFKIDGSFRERDSSSFASFAGGEFTGTTEIRTAAVSPQILLKHSRNNIGNSLTLGFDYQKISEEIVNRSIFFGVPSSGQFDFEREHYGYYLYEELSPMNRLTLSGGYRCDKADFVYKPSTPKKNSVDENAVNAGLNYQYDEKSYFYLGGSRSFRYPLFDESFNFFFSTIDKSLKPQKAKNYEVGFRHYLSDKAHVHVSLYRLNTEKEIFFNLSNYANENLDGKSRRKGLEISFNGEASEWLSLNGSYTYLDAAIRGGRFSGKEFPDVPKHKASLGATMNLGQGFTFSLNGFYTGRRSFVSDFDNAYDPQDDFVVINAKLKYVWKKIHAYLDINNVTGNDYSEYGVIGSNRTTFVPERAFYPSPKTNVFFGVSAEF